MYTWLATPHRGFSGPSRRVRRALKWIQIILLWAHYDDNTYLLCGFVLWLPCIPARVWLLSLLQTVDRSFHLACHDGHLVNRNKRPCDHVAYSAIFRSCSTLPNNIYWSSHDLCKCDGNNEEIPQLNKDMLVQAHVLKVHCLMIQLHSFLTFLFTGIFGRFSQVHGKLDYFWCHRRHFIAKAVVISAIHVGCKSIFSIGLPFSWVNNFLIWTCNLSYWKQKATLFARIFSIITMYGA